MTLRSRLILGLVTISIILVGPLVLGIQSLRELKNDANELAYKDFAASLLLGRMREVLYDVRRTELGLLFRKDQESRDAMDPGQPCRSHRGLARAVRSARVCERNSRVRSRVLGRRAGGIQGRARR